MKKNLEKMVICCVIAVCAATIGLSGCGEDYGPQINYLNDELDKTNEDLEATKAEVARLSNLLAQRVVELQTLINSKITVTNVETITTGVGGFRLTLSNGQIMEIQNGTNGTPGSVWSIDNSTGFWMIDGVLTSYRAVGVNAQAPYINPADTIWYIPQWNNNTNRYDTIPTTIKATGSETFISYVTGSAGNYTLHIRNEDKSWASIPLYTTSTPVAGATIELIGYVQGSAINPVGNLSLASVIDTAMMDLRFWHIPAAFAPWDYQKRVRAGQVFSDLTWNNVHLVVSTNATPASLNLLKFKRSDNVILPLKLGTPVQMNGVLTRSATPYGGSIYYIPIEVDTITYPGAIAGFQTPFGIDLAAVYYLTDEAGSLRSNYTGWTINTIPQTAITQSSVVALGGAAAISGVYTVSMNTDIGITFDGNARYVYDYYVSYPGANAGVTVNPLNGTFKTTATIAPQDTVVVHKLYVNGDLVNDTLTIKTP